jgi:ribonuclease HIII
MKTDFESYLRQVKQQLVPSGATITEKPLNYGRQLLVTKGQEKVVICVYHGKKGIKVVWGQTESALQKQCQNLLGEAGGQGTVPGVPGIFFAGAENFTDWWAGSDESGKGDYFGPLVVAAVCLQKSEAGKLIAAGVRDCKELTDKKILTLAALIKDTTPRYAVLVMKPAAYNRRYAELQERGQNLNNLLISGHYNALSKVLQQQPACRWVLIDQFTPDLTLVRQLRQDYPQLQTVRQKPKAEADIAVAVASVLARAAFLQGLQELAVRAGLPELPKGAGPQVTETAAELVRSQGRAALGQYVKLHFANSRALP